MPNLSSCQIRLFLALLVPLGAACSDDDEIASNEAARRAYLGMDASIAKSIQLGFDGFNAATNANIPAQMTTGTAGGTLTISGQVDAGVSANKEMRLYVGMVGYSDGDVSIGDGDTVRITYDTNADVTMQPFLELSLMNIPTGTLTGTLTGIYVLTGDLQGQMDLAITLSGSLMDSGGMVVRAPGTTTVTGTATSGDGVYDINITI